jgi:hypothetical protein
LVTFGSRGDVPRPPEGTATGGCVTGTEVRDVADSKSPARSSAGLPLDPAPPPEPVESSKSMSESGSFLPGRSSAGIEAGGVSPRLNASYRERTLLIWSFVWRYVSEGESDERCSAKQKYEHTKRLGIVRFCV